MAKLKKSVKAIIISLCLIVVLAGSAVGAIFAFNGKGNNSKNPNQNQSSGTPGASIVPEISFLENQKDFVESINSSIYNFDTVQNYDSKLIESSGFDIDNIVELTDTYIAVKENSEILVYLYLKDENGDYLFKSLKEALNISQDSNFIIYITSDDYILYGYSFKRENKNFMQIEMSKVSSFEEIVIVYDFEVECVTSTDLLIYNKYKTFNFSIFENYYLFYFGYNNSTSLVYDVYVLNYTNNYVEEKDIKIYEGFENLSNGNLDNKYYRLTIDGTSYFGCLDNNNNFIKFEIVENSDYLYRYNYTSKGLFIEKIKQIEFDSELTNNSVKDLESGITAEYSYEFYDFSTKQIKCVDLQNSNLKATCVDLLNDKYISLYEQKTENYILSNAGEFVYYDVNTLKPIFAYESSSKENKALYANQNSVLTADGIYKVKDGKLSTLVFKFAQDDKNYQIKTTNFVGDNFFVYDLISSRYVLMNMSGQLVDQTYYVNLCEYNDGKYILKDELNNVSLFDLKTLDFDPIDGFVETKLNNSLAFVGFGVYFTGNAGNYVMHSLESEDTLSGIEDFSIENMNSNTVLKITKNNAIHYSVKYDVQILDVNSVGNNNDGIQLTSTNNYDSIASKNYYYNGYACGFIAVSHYTTYTKVKINSYLGFIPTSGVVNLGVDHNSSSDSLIAPSYSWSIDWSAGTYSMSCDDGNWAGDYNRITSHSCTVNDTYYTITELTFNCQIYIINIFQSAETNWQYYVGNIRTDRTNTMTVTGVTYTITLDPRNTGDGDDSADTAGSTSITEVYTTSITSTITPPTNRGYTFEGYYLTTAGTGQQIIDKDGKVLASNVKFSSDRAIYAKWKAHQYNISYNYVLNDVKPGTYAPTKLTYAATGGANDANISNPAKMGYTFTGWNITGMDATTHWWGGTSSTSTSATGVMADSGYINLTSVDNATVTFTATWQINTYTVKFAINNPNSETDDYTIDSQGTKTYNVEFTVNHPTKTGYTFTGWTITGMNKACPTTGDDVTHYYGSSTMTGETISSTKETKFKNLRSYAGDVTFTANWSANQYTIAFEYGDGGYLPTGKSNPNTGTFDTFFKAEIPIKTGYTFASWKITGATTTGVNSKNVKHYYGNNDSATTNFTGNSQDNLNYSYFKNLRHTSGTVTLTANWTANTYQIDFDINNPNSVTTDYTIDADTSKTYNSAFSVNNPTKVGYIFTHWLIQGMDQTSCVTGDTITHYHGSSSSNLTGFTGETLDNVTSNWFKNLRSTGTDSNGNVVKVKFVAQWTPIIYTIKYNTNSGKFASGVNNPTTNIRYDWELANGETLIIQSPLRHGYDFTGWEISSKNSNFTTYTDSHTIRYPNTTDVGYDNLTTSHGDEITFKALWAATTYTVSLKYNNPTKADETKTFTFDQEYTIANPTRMGYIFKDWTITGCSVCDTEDFECKHKYGSTEFTGVSVNQITATTFKNLHCIYNSTVTFTANWTAKEYNIQLGNETSGYGIEYTQKPKYDSWFSIKAPTTYKLGYHFGGWVVTQMNNKDENTNETVDHFYGTSTSSTLKVNGTEMTREITDTTYYFKNLSSNQDATVIITVIWVPNTYVVTFDLNNPNWVAGDISSQADITATYDAKFTVSKPTKAGYKFLGWSLYDLSNDCDHYYATNSTTTMTKFTTDNSRFVNSATGKDAVVDVTCFMNLRSDHNSGTKALLKANWEAREYNIVYHYLPASLDVTAYQKEELNTKINIASMMTQTITVTVTYDRIYTALNYKDNEEENEFYAFGLPIGLRLICWSISADTVAGTTVLGKYQTVSGEQVIVTNLSDSIVPFEERIYGPGKIEANYTDWLYYPENPDSDKEIHLYATYDLAGIKLRYYFPTTSSGRNYLESYKNVENNVFGVDLSSLNTSAKYTEVVTFANSTNIPYYDSLVGYMIVATYDSSGQITKDSLTRFVYQGTTYVAYKGNRVHWGFTNVDAYSYEDPTYFLYAIYDEEYSGNYDKLQFTYDSTKQSYSVVGTDSNITSIKVPSHYDNGTTGYKPVAVIGANAFSNYNSLSNVVLPNTILKINDSAFYWTISLSSIDLPDKLTYIGNYAFSSSGLNTNIVMPNTLEIIDDAAFSYPYYTATFVLNEGLRTIGNAAFYGQAFTSINLPSTLTSIGYSAFMYTSLTSITIPKGVTEISADTFNYCTSLASVSFEPVSSLISIRDSAFYGCSALSLINIPNSVKSIGNYAFEECLSLETVTMPDSLISMGDRAFASCSNLEAIVIPAGLTSIGEACFYECVDLASITIYEGINSIESEAFFGCESLTNIVVPKSVQSIGFSAFGGCNALESITLPFVGYSRTEETDNYFGYIFGAIDASVNDSYVPVSLTSVTITDDETIDEYAFNSCFTIISLTISDTVSIIGYGAFFNCYSIVTLTVPFIGYSRTDSENGYFGFWHDQTADTKINEYLTSLTTVNITDASAIYDYALYEANSVTTLNLNEGITSIGKCAFHDLSITTIVIPASVTVIGQQSFEECRKLTYINLNEGLTTIGQSAFNTCEKLNNVIIPSTVTTMSSYVFSKCIALTSIVILDGVTTFDAFMFYQCSALSSIRLPKTITSIGQRTFYECTALTTVHIQEGVTSIGSNAFKGCTSLNNITLPQSLKEIGSYAFSGCTSTNFNSIIIPKSVKTIGEGAFKDCSSLSSVKLSSALTTIGVSAFKSTPIVRIEIPNGVTTIGASAFESCSSLNTVILYKSVTSVGNYAFNSSSIAHVYYGGTTTEFSAMSLNSTNQYLINALEITNYDKMIFTYTGSSYSIKGYTTYGKKVIGDLAIPTYYNDGVNGYYVVDEIENEAFKDNSSITAVSMSNNVKVIGNSAFYGCTTMATITMSTALTEIGAYAFRNCDALTQINIPTNVTVINPYTFYDCDALTTVTFSSSTKVTYVGEYAFYDCFYLENITLPSSVKAINDHAFYRTKINDDFVFPSSLTHIGRAAFRACGGFVRLVLPDTITVLEELAFASCTCIEAVYIPNNITTISAHSYDTSPFYSGNSNMAIFAEADNKSSGWGPYWNYRGSTSRYLVFFDYDFLPKVTFANLASFYQEDDGTIKTTKTSSFYIHTTDDYINARFEFKITGDNLLSMGRSYDGVGTSLLYRTNANMIDYESYNVLLAPKEGINISGNTGFNIRNLRFDKIESLSNTYGFNINTSYNELNKTYDLISSNKAQPNSSSYFTLTAQDNVDVSFKYYVNSEGSTYDNLHVYINGIEDFKQGGTSQTDYILKHYSLNKGDIIQFRYKKDGSVNSGDDRAIIRDLQIKSQVLFLDNTDPSYGVPVVAYDYTHIELSTVDGWEIVGKSITTNRYNARLVFKYKIFNTYTQLSGYNGIALQVTSKVDNSHNTDHSITMTALSTTKGVYLAELIIPNPGSYYLTLNFGHANDGQSIKMDIGCVYAYGLNYTRASLSDFSSTYHGTFSIKTFVPSNGNITPSNSRGDYYYNISSSTEQLNSTSSEYALTAPYPLLFTFDMYVYSESVDHVYIELNGTKVKDLSGSTYSSWKNYAFSLNTGDVLKIKYTKDYSVNTNIDGYYMKNINISRDYGFTYDSSTSTYTSNNVNVQNSTSTYVYHTYTSSKTVSFNYELSSENNNDRLLVYLNGELIFSSYGTTSGTFSKSIAINSSLIIMYIKDDNVDGGSDTCKITNMTA